MYSKSISNSLIHCIAVYFFTEGLICLCYRSSGKVYKCGLWEGFFKHLCIRLRNHSFHIFVSILTELNLLRMLKLCSMSLIRETRLNAMTEKAEREGLKMRIKEMQEFLENQTDRTSEYDEQLVRKMIEKLTIYDKKFVIEFKSAQVWM